MRAIVTLPAQLTMLGGLQLGYYDPAERLHYAGGVGTGFSDRQFCKCGGGCSTGWPPRRRRGLLVAGDDPLDPAIRWVRPELVVAVRFVGWSGSGRVRHAVFLGLREDKPPPQVIHDIADPEAPRWTPKARPTAGAGITPAGRLRSKVAVPPRRRA
jgi:bifunctional non-homologous end joining protein LigD